MRAELSQALPLAERLFEEIGSRTRRGEGILRAPYGEGEQAAADLLAKAGRSLGLEPKSDWAGNLYLTYPGTDAAAPVHFVGSHMDSVPNGGNFDGLAGIVAGLVAIAALQRARSRPRRGITVMGVRAEENGWFGAGHVGSRLALGCFDPEQLDASRRIDTGKTLAEHIAAAGFDVAPLRERRAWLRPPDIAAFVELHIEQGPLLENRAIPVGIVSAIRGNVRCGDCVCTGAYDHSGTVPRELRHDAVLATAELAMQMDRLWDDWLDDGKDLVLTFGQFQTDPKAHSITTIPGEVRFAFDARSHSSETLHLLKEELLRRADQISQERGVSFRFGRFSASDPAPMSESLRKILSDGAAELGIPTLDMPSGAGHDAADFALNGVPSAMIFVRNAHGSHNPAESMRMEDFARGTELLLWFLTH
jgi:N-carbamoyl-L-amino-acid hydrolase